MIVGTAGHIDHGKTALVRALTGIDTDRTREEKERGISIELGFAPLLLPSGKRIGIVDVPGHERFIRNMLAGAGGMDLILLVIDAREGVMPQTREHVDILQLLEVTAGILVVTKVDLVDEEWLAFMHDEIRTQMAGTFLENAPMVDVSAVSGQGLDVLRAVIEQSLLRVQPKSSVGAVRMPIDRVFRVAGFGSVVTGTMWRGQLRVGDAVELLPTSEALRVRSLQVHGEQVAQAMAGQRVAVSFTNVRGEIKRGMTLATPHTLIPSRLLDVRLRVLQDSPFVLKHRMRVRFYHATAEVMGRVLLLRDQEVAVGEEALAQVLLEQPVVVEARDHFVLRSFSPMHTLGGGIVIDPHPARLHRRNSTEIVLQLLRREGGTLRERLLDQIQSAPDAELFELAKKLNVTLEELRPVFQDLVTTGELIEFENNGWLPKNLLISWENEFVHALEEYYQKNAYDLWMPKSVAYRVLKANGVPPRFHDQLLSNLGARGILVVEAERVQKPGRQIALTTDEKLMQSAILKQLQGQPFAPPTLQELEKVYKGREKGLRLVLHALVQADEIVFISQDLFLSVSALHAAEVAARKLYEERGPFAVADFRDQTRTSRKFAVAILEYLDRQKKTRRTGDVRVFLENS
ncbi:selenocysteine-specific translation elongation factor [Sulfoacidibacillus thermotolerans]|uniref:Selenocysteine-specific elongation factor n=1 Tax=Sulfoacidibacillus thermotolerans TaxID=1765684 RepID=A0A2U3D8S2_SULT2|nr:selenocysteine-specific translation elongation factor [Sulfoacidibacillus thermotolerans]PWI57676.1 selenocysteine-specific translation elongation factor [Sulfoacidibacillus thermotolerans]